MEQLIPLLISLASGAAGGNIVGAVLKNFNLGTLGNSLVGILGGGLGASVLGMLGMGAGAEMGAEVAGGMGANIVGNLVSGLAGGGVLLPIIGVIRQVIGK